MLGSAQITNYVFGLVLGLEMFFVFNFLNCVGLAHAPNKSFG